MENNKDLEITEDILEESGITDEEIEDIEEKIENLEYEVIKDVSVEY